MLTAWVIPLAALGVLAWYRPAGPIPIFAILAAGVVGVSIWFAGEPWGLDLPSWCSPSARLVH